MVASNCRYYVFIVSAGRLALSLARSQPLPRPARIPVRYNIVGLRRSGNHALINWISRQLPLPVAFFNDTDPAAPYDFERLDQRVNIRWDGPVAVIAGFEDRLTTTIEDRAADTLDWPEPERTVNVLLLRNPFNLIASRQRHYDVSESATTYISGLNPSELWLTYAMEATGRTSTLGKPMVVANFDRWTADVAYRRQLAERLGLTFTDAGRDEVTAFGEGSSFEGKSRDGQASSMRTDQRWQVYRDDPAYRANFRDSLLFDLARECFELDEALERYIDNELLPQVTFTAGLKRHFKLRILPQTISMCRRNRITRWAYHSFGRSLLGRG